MGATRYAARTLRRWWREPHHYYWMTALIAARGGQRLACRRICLATLGFGSLAGLMLFSPAGPSGPINRGIAIAAILVTCLAAVGWLRSSWPSRRQSIVYLVVISGCTVASALTQSNPVSGFVVVMSFGAVCGYAVFFHTARYFYPVVGVAMATAAILVVRLSIQGELVWALCLAASVVLIVMPVGVLCHGLVQLLGINTMEADIEPLTGLLSRDAFYSAIGGLLGSRQRWHDRYLLLLVVSLDMSSDLTRAGGRAAGEQARVAAAAALRETTRTNALLGHLSDSEFVVVDSGAATDWEPLAERIRNGVTAHPPFTSVSIGVVTIPIDRLSERPLEELLDALIEIATQTMQDARLGDSQIRHVGLPKTSDFDHGRRDSLP